jgi:hypothetical protein
MLLGLLQSRFGLGSACPANCEVADYRDWPNDKFGDQPGHAAKVVNQGSTSGSSDESSATHNMQVENRRCDREHTQHDHGSAWRRCMRSAVREPVKCLCQAGNTHHNGQVAEQARTETECPLLQSRVKPASERNIPQFNGHNRQAAMEV